MVSDEQLIADLQEFSDELGEIPTRRQMDGSGPWSSSTYSRYFGSWNDALEAAGLEINEKQNVSKEKLIKDLKEFADELGEIPKRRQMEHCGPWGSNTYKYRFGSWNDALEAAGLELRKRGISEEKLIKDLQQFAYKLGETPTCVQMSKSGPLSDEVYKNHFGSWNDALEAAGLEINCLGPKERAGIGGRAYGEGYTEARRKALERDNYECRVCGIEEHLNCHHIKPRREFDDVSESNTLDNLIILCASCHRTYEGRWADCTPDEFAHWASLAHNS